MSEKHLPKYTLQTICAYQTKFRDLFFNYYKDNDLDVLVSSIACLLGVDRQVVKNTLNSFKCYDKLTISALAGNYIRLKEGKALPVWVGHPEEEWALCRIMGADLINNHMAISFDVLSGWSAGREGNQYLYHSDVIKLNKALGWNRRWRDHPWYLCNFVGCYGFLLLKESYGDTHSIRFRQARAPDRLLKLNNSLWEDRYSVRCPYDYKPDVYVSCHTCHVGYNLDKRGSCNLATHARWRDDRNIPEDVKRDGVTTGETEGG